MRRRLSKAILVVGAVALLAGTGTVAAKSRHTQASQYNVGVVYSRTGLLSAYGAEFAQGIRLGVQYATNGTNKVNGTKINLNFVDDKTDPATGVSAMKDLIGQGYKIITGATSSGVALQEGPLAAQNQVLFIPGPAASDAITGLNRYTFRAGRQTYQDVAVIVSYLEGSGKNVLVLAQDSAFGQGNVAVVKQLAGSKQNVSSVLVPLTATDLTPFAQQVKQAKPDAVVVAWAGTTALAMWSALDQQGVFDSVKSVITGLAERATYPAYGPAIAKIHFSSHYVYGAPNNKVNNWLRAQMRKKSQFPDLFTPDGFAAGQMIVHALQKAGGDDVSKMITALEGWKFLAPKGWQAIRPQDHAMLQPMFRVSLSQVNKVWVPKVLGTATPYATAPPISTVFQG